MDIKINDKEEREMSEERRRRGGKIAIIVAGVCLVFGLLGGVIGLKIGEKRGEERVVRETEERVGRLGEIVLEKSEVARAGREILEFSGETLKMTDLEGLVRGLKEMRERATLREAKEAINELVERVAEFKEVFEGGDSVAITHEYESLKDAARTASEKINSAYNSEIASLTKS